MVKMHVYRVAIDPHKRVPLVLLADEEMERLLPIYIGIFEANAIASEMQDLDFPRPLTHDLLRNLIEELGLRLETVLITHLREGVFYAVLQIEGPGTALELDSRPSDAIALALRTGSPILVAEEVLEVAQILPSDLQDEDESQRLRELLEELPVDPDLLDLDEPGE